MRARFINWGCVGPVLITLAIIAALITGVILIARHDRLAAVHPIARALPQDALGRDLIRCQELGTKAQGDAGCLAAWSENRRRFFGSNK